MKHFLDCRLWPAQDGVSAVEFALLAGILGTLLLGVLDFGIGFWEKMEVENAARAGAEYAVKNGYGATSIQSAVTSATSLSGIQATPAPAETCGCPNASLGITRHDCGSTCPDGELAGTYVTVNAQVSYSTIFSWPGIANPMTLASSVTVRLN